MNASSIVTPGAVLASASEGVCGEGTYAKNGVIYASLTGSIFTTDSDEGKMFHVKSLRSDNDCDALISVGTTVLCRVSRIQLNQVILDIFAVNETQELKIKSKGVIRREDVRLSEIDKVVMAECFKPGDIVRAKVLSLGDARQYYLSTAASEFGVLWAMNEESGGIMTPLNWKEMVDPVTKQTENRKAAKPN
jgi:exosome complex component CSL4